MRITIAISVICLGILIIGYLLFNKIRTTDPRGNFYIGSASCKNCHANLYNSYIHTAHYLSALPANANTVHGSFKAGSNVFIVNDSQKVVMEKIADSIFQTYYFKGRIKERYRFDIVFGGVKGESYLSWKEDKLYQMPLSYFAKENQWSTSPGYGFDFLDYPHLRSIGKQCLECHTSYINNFSDKSPEFSKEEEFDKTTLVYNIDCERCHGPGKQHADFQENHPEIKSGRFITSYKSLNRIQKLDMCAVCHSGKPTAKLRSSFEFIPGDSFANFKLPELYQKTDTDISHLDVHGNQLQLLQSSKCYMKSNINCTTCHDPHQNNRGNIGLYVQKCLNCHNSENHMVCKISGTVTTSQLNSNCISCHMPALPTKIISVRVSDVKPAIQFFVHTHRIATYPDEVKKVMAYINN